MASFNAEIAFKALEKRVDRIDTFLTTIDKQVKVLVETRGASKEKAVEELLKTVPAMHEADKKLQANVSLLAAQLTKEKADFERLGAAAQAALSKEFEAAQKEQEASIEALDKDLRTRLDTQVAQAKTLSAQLIEATNKRHEAEVQKLAKQAEEQGKEYQRLNRALEERVRMEATFEAKLAALRGVVTGLEAAVTRLSK
jgi:hypothetical protein